MLDDRETAYRKDKTVLKPTPARYKKEHPYLKEVDSLALANVQINLEQAYKNFFTVPGTKHPKFKSKKHSRNSYTTNNQKRTIRVDTEAGTIHLPKFTKAMGDLKAVFHRPIPENCKLKSATISMERDGTYYCSLLFENDDTVDTVSHPEDNAIGLDYKSDGLYSDSEGNVCGSPKYYRKAQKSRTHAQRALRHKDKNSNNWKKQQKRVAKIERHVANQRKDFLHKQSTSIIKKYDLIAVESLDMRAMSNKGFGNGKATLDNGWGMFVKMLEYKAERTGKTVIKVDKWFPSSQLCSNCGYQNAGTKDLDVRKWICLVCGSNHDRDHNAAVNIRKEGIRLYQASA